MVLNLIYEEKHRSRGEFHLAGGHFKQGVDSRVLNKVDDGMIRVTACDTITDLESCGISYVRFTAKLQETDFSENKFSTTFPDSIKQNFYGYVGHLFSVASGRHDESITCLSTQVVGDRAVYLLRHKAAFFNGFSAQEQFESDQDIYVCMVVFDEDGTKVIWTCYLLGVFIIDWADIEPQMNESTCAEIRFHGMPLPKESITKKIYEVYSDIECQKKKAEREKVERQRARDSAAPERRRGGTSKSKVQEQTSDNAEYSFEEHGTTYNLISIGNGCYVKISKEDFERVAQSYASSRVPQARASLRKDHAGSGMR